MINEIEGKKRMGKTRDLFKKIRDTKGTFHAKMSTIKERNGMALTEAEDIKKRWQEYTEEIHKKDLQDPDNHDGVIPHLEPDILECKVKWAVGSITTNKASGGDGIPVELFQILRGEILKGESAVFNMPANLENSAIATGLEKVLWSNPKGPIPKKGNAKECSDSHTIALISLASKVMLKFSKPGFNST